VISSDFCSGNLAKAQRGKDKNHIDLWVCADSQPYFNHSDFYKTWFYFSVTGVPRGQSITFTFRNLDNQVGFYNRKLPANVYVEQTLLVGIQARLQSDGPSARKVEKTTFEADLLDGRLHAVHTEI
jgi:hypothetical protein